MKRVVLPWLLCGAAVALPAQAWSFKHSPCLRALTFEAGTLGQDRLRWFNRCPELLPQEYKAAVHEHMTLAAMKEYRGQAGLIRTASGWRYDYMTEAVWQGQAGREHLSRGIVFGTWWNDDPLMLTWGEGWDLLDGGLLAAEFLKDGKPEYHGAGCPSVKAEQHLARWSHFGPLQHLHFMTNLRYGESTAEQRIATTTDKALSWMKFAYAVATGAKDHRPDDRLTEEMEREAGLPSIALNHCVKDKHHVKIRTVFTLRDKTWTDDYRRTITPDVALGSMLHVLQDSFSPAHTCRVERQSEDGPYAVITDVENYNGQDHDSHGALDNYPDWLTEHARTGTHAYQNDPVRLGAWLLRAVDDRLAWEKVEAHLRKTIFASAASSKSGSSCLGGQALRR